LDTSLLEEVRFRTGLFIKPYLVKEEELNHVLMEYYDRRKTPRTPAGQTTKELIIEEEVSKPSIIEALNLLLLQAARVNASDIHLEPHQEKICLRLRIDGVLKR